MGDPKVSMFYNLVKRYYLRQSKKRATLITLQETLDQCSEQFIEICCKVDSKHATILFELGRNLSSTHKALQELIDAQK